MPKKILIVDDDREWNFLLKMKLGIAGYATDQAFNGKDAVDKIAQSRPDLVLLDITMPVMDGWEVCAHLRAAEETKSLPIVIQSSLTHPEDLQRSKSFLVERYLLKPCSPDAIVQSIRDILTPK